MYDINTKNVRKGISSCFIYLAACILFLIFIFYSTFANIFKQYIFNSSTMSNGVITKTYNDDGVTKYYNIYYFKANEIQYSCNSSILSTTDSNKDNMKIYYISSKPSVCMVDEYETFDIMQLIVSFFPILFVILISKKIKKINKRISLIKELNYKGKLVKNIPYYLEDTGIEVNGVEIKRPVIDYELSNGTKITLYGDPRHDKKLSDEDGMVDLVIDESNPENYFIDYQINRISNSSEQDYYNQNIIKQQKLDENMQSNQNSNDNNNMI